MMPHYLAHDLVYHLLVFEVILVLIMLSNAWALRRTGRHATPARLPKVSILLPARNEQTNIARCVQSLLSQDYADSELLVLDDRSTDRTRTILESLEASNTRLRVLDGRPLEERWLGKNWACAQLAAQAGGELLFFTDADTLHRPEALRAVVTALEGEHADLMSGLPRQQVRTWGEKLIVPFFSWVIYCFMPLAVGQRARLPGLSCAVGQMLLFRRTAYEAIGGHDAVRSSIAEDLALARRVQSLGYRWRIMEAAHLVSCRMYRTGREAYDGLSKNLFAAFGFRLVPYFFAWLWLAVMFFTPLVDLGAWALGVPGMPHAAVLACIALALALWLFPYARLGLPLLPAVFYPVTLLVMEVVASRSLTLALSGGLTWKGRSLVRPRMRLW